VAYMEVFSHPDLSTEVELHLRCL